MKASRGGFAYLRALCFILFRGRLEKRVYTFLGCETDGSGLGAWSVVTGGEEVSVGDYAATFRFKRKFIGGAHSPKCFCGVRWQQGGGFTSIPRYVLSNNATNTCLTDEAFQNLNDSPGEIEPQ